MEKTQKDQETKDQLEVEATKAIMNKTRLYITIEKTSWWIKGDSFTVTHYKPDVTEYTIKYKAEE